MSVVKILFILCTVLYSIDQVSCIICYHCDSHVDPACATDPTREDYKIDCSAPKVFSRNSTFTFPNLGNATLKSMLKNVDGIQARNRFDECAKMSATWQGYGGIIRVCSSSLVSIEELRKIAEKRKITIKTVSRCGTDLCNSSSNLNVGFISFVGLLFLVAEF